MNTDAIELAELILSMQMTSAKGQHARHLARKVLGIDTPLHDGSDDVAITTNGTTRFIPRAEPVFLLRAQDRFATQAVNHWAWLVKHSGDERLADAAFEHAEKMDAWPIKKTPDLFVDKDL